MKPFMQPGRGAASPRPAAARAGGLSMAFSGGDGGGKKRGLASLNPSAPADALAGAFGGIDGSGSQHLTPQKQQPQPQQQQQQQQKQQQQKQQQQQQYSKLPAGGLSTQFGSGQFSVGSCDDFQHSDAFAGAPPLAPSPLSPLSEISQQRLSGSAQPSSLSDALAISSRPRYKVPRRQPVSAANSATAASLTAAADLESEDTFGDDAPGVSAAGWAISGTPPHVMTATAAAAAMSMPHGPASPAYGEFRPGSVYEGAGRKLRGTEAMRMRNAVLRQTGFLEPQNTDNMFSDHNTGGTPPQHAQLATSVS